jgi:hypothetical protein
MVDTPARAPGDIEARPQAAGDIFLARVRAAGSFLLERPGFRGGRECGFAVTGRGSEKVDGWRFSAGVGGGWRAWGWRGSEDGRRREGAGCWG